jgi:hypothetical protein
MSGAPWAPSRTITELQERQASKGKRTGGEGAQTTNAEQRSLGDRRARKQVGYGIAIRRVVGLVADEQIAGIGTALVFAGLALALVMAVLWHTAEVAPLAFIFTFAIALAHAVSSACRSPWCFGQRGGSTF